jgi:hypothetical protein
MHFIIPLSPLQCYDRCPINRTSAGHQDTDIYTPGSEASKPTSRWVVKSAMLQLKSDEPWSTLQAQLLMKISALLKPRVLDYKQYQVYFYIPCSILKPGMILSNEDDYSILLQCVIALKKPDPNINIDIMEQEVNHVEKENEEFEEEKQPKKKKKQVCTCFFPCILILP